MDNDNFTPDEFAGKADEIKSEIENGLENVSESFDTAAENAASSAEEAASELKETAETVSSDLSDAADELSGAADAAADELIEMQETATGKAEELSDKLTDGVETLQEAAEEHLEDLKTEAEAAEEEIPAPAVKDAVETVDYAPVPQPEDILQDPKSINSHRPSIPQYVPKPYSREVPAGDAERAVRGSVNSEDYAGVPPIDDVEPAPKGAIDNGKQGQSGNKVWIWIAIAAVIILVLLGCCLIQGFFGFMKVLTN